MLLGSLVVALRRPTLRGTLSVRRDGRLVREFLLSGRAMNLSDAATPGLEGSVVARAAKDATPAVGVRTRVAGKREDRVLLDGQELIAGPFSISYETQHSRAMSMIVSGLDDTKE